VALTQQAFFAATLEWILSRGRLWPRPSPARTPAVRSWPTTSPSIRGIRR